MSNFDDVLPTESRVADRIRDNNSRLSIHKVDNKEIRIDEWYGQILVSKDNKYCVLKHFTRSGYGEMFLSITSDNYLVLLKVFTNKNDLENEVTNVRVVQKTMDESFLPYLDYFITKIEDENFYVLVMKYFEGWILLSDYLKKNLFYEEQRSHIKDKLETIIQKLHKMSIVHHDIDPTKILVHSKTGHIRMMDLGYCITRFSMNVSDEDFQSLKDEDIEMLESL